MNISSIQEQILKLKKEKDVCILAHSYQAHEILEIADYTGDSYKLSVDASKAENKNILMCGVRFMAETCKILSPEKLFTLHSLLPAAVWQTRWTNSLFLRLRKCTPITQLLHTSILRQNSNNLRCMRNKLIGC